MDPIQTVQLVIPIKGMNCSGCAANVERAIRKLMGVSHVAVDLKGNRAEIEYDPNQVSKPDFVSAVERAGYSVPESTPSTFNTGRFKTFKKPNGTE
ncbi:heavy-metal-associated domain-containing protein [bacterium]|nr:heavy-metal-associated domain-containing protein [bacterium]